VADGAELLAEGRRRYEAGDFADAEPLARRALELRPPAGSAGPRAEALQLVAEIAFSQGRYPEAQDIAGQARDLRAGGSAEEAAETDNLLGIIALARGDATAARALLERALAARETTLGRDASDTIESLNNLAAALARDGRIDEAIALNRDSLARCGRAFDEPHRALAVTLNALAVKLDRAEATRPEAGELYARALVVAEAAMGPEHPMVATFLANRATQLLNAGDPESARSYVARSVDLHERRHGPTHPNTATALLNAVELARIDGDPAGARALVERALAIRLAVFGPTDLRTRQLIVRLLTILGSLGTADPTVVSDGIFVLEFHRAVAPPAEGAPARQPDPELVERLRAYLDRRRTAGAPLDDAASRLLDRARLATLAADAAFIAGDHDAARLALADAIRGTEEVRGREDLALVELLHRRAAIARASDRGDEAIRDDERALAILGSAYGGRHPFVLRARTYLAHELEREFGPAAARAVLLELRGLIEGVDGAGMGPHIRDLLDRHLERIPPESVADPVGRSARRRAALAAPDSLVRLVLPGLDRVDWAAQTHARGSATDVPVNLRLLAAEDPLVVADAADRLVDAVLHRGTLTPATPALIDPLLALAGDQRIPNRGPAIEVLTAILLGAGVRASAAGSAAADSVVVRGLMARIPEAVAVLDRIAHGPDPDARSAADAARTMLVRAGMVPDRGRAN
jgi:tetratricopeptide (TPR) repeat protein